MRSLDVIGVLALSVVVACSSADEPSIPADSLQQDESFVAIARATSSEATAHQHALDSRGGVTGDGSGDNEAFYIAIHKRELGKKWFLSAFLKQYFPGAVAYGAARSLGTRVVSFKVQNGKLYVFDVDDRKPVSETFDPQVLVEAYPVVTDYAPFNALAGNADYVLFDPSAGLNRFGVLGDAHADGSAGAAWGAQFETELSYLQRFRKIGDGVTYEQVFSGYSDLPSDADGYVETNVFRASGTIGIALRKYQEGSGFQIRPYDPHYFYGDLFNVPDQATIDAYAAHWNIYPGMKPIQWLISPQIAELQTRPEFAAYDIVGAVEQGIEGWNEAFGFVALEAKVAAPTDSYGDDDKNYLIFDGDPTYGAAFANWRVNPNTAEIRGASVYMNAIWFDDSMFQDDPEDGAPTPAVERPVAKPRPRTIALGWDAFPSGNLCTRFHPSFEASGDFPAANSGLRMTKKQKFEAYIRSVVTHEIGHTLGLRHNFKGSLTPPSTSVMDYLTTNDSIATAAPQAYDVAAIRYLYGLSTTAPAQAFCNDSGVRTDPTCATFDRGAQPREQFWTPTYVYFADMVITRGWTNASLNNTVSHYLNGLLGFARTTSDPAVASAVLSTALGKGKAPVTGLTGAPAANADKLATYALLRLFADAPADRGSIVVQPALAQVYADARVQIGQILTNADGVRSFESRRAMVDILKLMQSNEAYDVLVTSRASIAAIRPTLTGSDASLTDELLSRIDAATAVYFD
jgi:Met-zincin